MDEYIKRKEAILTVRGYAKHSIDKGRKSLDTVDDAIHMCDEIDRLPAADVVPVVRCKDCKYRTEERRGLVRCRAFNYMPMCVDNFCSYGERKDGGADNG